MTLPRLRALRLARFLSQAELARRSHVSQSTIIRLEHGAPAEFSTVLKLADAMGVTPAELARPVDAP